MTYNLEFVYVIISRLNRAGINTVLFGGWAKELNKQILPCTHNDIDLLCLDNDFKKLDSFIISNNDIVEIKLKHFSHKRAFLYCGIMIELLLVKSDGTEYVTPFWDEYFFKWSSVLKHDVSLPQLGKIPVADFSMIQFYQNNYHLIQEIRNRKLGGK